MAAAHLFGLGDAQTMQPPLPQQAAPPPPAAAPALKKKRNQPGNPNPDAEVIALSPKTLLATNRFVCEVCNKGFQREQNLQLHRRGHNLPWKLKQKNPKETRRRVYLCPEPSCVHHDPSRALGDLTGIKKHYCRKHGEKKWKCDKCNKRYAVQSDWKAHSKTCGTREYRCDCGTLFSRRDSFITHRAFCDALAQESARAPPIGAGMYGSGGMALGLSGLAASQLHSFQDQQAHSSAATAITAGVVLLLAFLPRRRRGRPPEPTGTHLAAPRQAGLPRPDAAAGAARPAGEQRPPKPGLLLGREQRPGRAPRLPGPVQRCRRRERPRRWRRAWQQRRQHRVRGHLLREQPNGQPNGSRRRRRLLFILVQLNRDRRAAADVGDGAVTEGRADGRDDERRRRRQREFSAQGPR
ncbi:hypothetical protein PVAP13_6KG404500 [Panicum virgatum]|uniref:Protein EARLY HEADING DATE 2 n=1 Tax=Panicum virgatum TaxID=38727 RepID=A0A8T0RL13_PANVG|nr:hypothetical protein PVAP13_6KG404500 [Panicum virgatum]